MVSCEMRAVVKSLREKKTPIARKINFHKFIWSIIGFSARKVRRRDQRCRWTWIRMIFLFTNKSFGIFFYFLLSRSIKYSEISFWSFCSILEPLFEKFFDVRIHIQTSARSFHQLLNKKFLPKTRKLRKHEHEHIEQQTSKSLSNE